MRGDYLTIRVQQHSSGSVNEVIADTTSVNIDFSAEALETTSQDSGLHAEFEQGKVSCTISGDYLATTTLLQFTQLFAHMNAGDILEIEAYRGATPVMFLEGDAVLTSLSLSGGNSDQLVTGGFSMQCSGNMATS